MFVDDYKRYRVDGPWLVDASALAQLERSVDKCWAKVVEGHDDAVAKEVQARKAYALRESDADIEKAARSAPHVALYRGFTFTTKSEREYTCERLETAIDDAELARDRCTGFVYEIRIGYTYAKIELDRNVVRVTRNKSSAEIRAVYDRMTLWCDDQKPSAVRQWLRDWSFLLWIATSLALICTGVAWVSLNRNAMDSEIAARLLQEGISPDETTTALGLLLRKAYNVSRQSYEITKLGWEAIGGAIWLCIASSIHTSGEIGVGRGKDSITKWRRWYRFVYYSLPAFIIGGIATALLF